MPNLQLAQEVIPPDEAKCTENLAARLKAKVTKENPPGPMGRDAHPKMHGLVKAEFIVEPDLPPELRVGLFREPKTFQAWIRFSNQNAAIKPDREPDIRGMALKVMGVPGEKILEDERNEQTQDFLLISASAFVTKDVKQFDDLVIALTGGTFATFWFFLTHWGVLGNLLKSMKKFANPLQIRYFSSTPYLFGSHAVKYSATPHIGAVDTIPDDPPDNFLRQAMVKRLKEGDALFDFAVQLQTDAAAMPLENPSVEWPESKSPFRKVATVRVLRQEFDSAAQDTFGENLSFTPWHALPEHRPLGGVNRARKVVYRAISMFRHECNGLPRKEPAGWEM